MPSLVDSAAGQFTQKQIIFFPLCSTFTQLLEQEDEIEESVGDIYVKEVESFELCPMTWGAKFHRLKGLINF